MQGQPNNLSIESFVRISPPIWPGGELEIQPGDLSKFAAMGSGIGAPMTILPGVSAEDAIKSRKFYEPHEHSWHPIHGAPLTEQTGGAVYFRSSIAQSDFQCLLGILDSSGEKSYAAFVAHSQDPKQDSYLTQLRIISRFALRFKYGALDEQQYEAFPEQELSADEVLWRFVKQQCSVWAWRGGESPLSGVMGGDGYFGEELLAFGFLAENTHHGVCRIWSRAIILTK